MSNSTGGTFFLIGEPNIGDTAQYDGSWIRGCYQSSTDSVHGFMDGYSTISLSIISRLGLR